MKNLRSLARTASAALCMFVFSLCSYAIDVNPVDFGAVVNDGKDDTAAIQAAVNAVLKVGGGTVNFPSGKLELMDQINLVPHGYIGGDVRFKGNRGSTVGISLPFGKIAFYAGNLNSWTIEDLTFIGKNVPSHDPRFFDAWWVIYSNYVQQTRIIRSQFFGLATRSNGGIVYSGITDMRIVDSQFDGNLAQYPEGAVIYAPSDSIGLTVQGTTFLDYANFRGEYLSKSPGFTGAWIRVNGGQTLNATGQRRYVIKDSRFDEAAASAIRIENIVWAQIEGVNVNVNGSSPGNGIFLKNVEHASVEQSWFGYTTNPRPAIVAENVGGLDINALRFTAGVYFIDRTGGGTIDVRNCPQCTMPAQKK